MPFAVPFATRLTSENRAPSPGSRSKSTKSGSSNEPRRELTVYRHTPHGYVPALLAGAHERVRAEPFDAVELSVAFLLGGDPDD